MRAADVEPVCGVLRSGSAGGAHMLARLPDVFELWGVFHDAAGLVQQGSALLESSNRLPHLRWVYEEVPEGDNE